MASLDQAAPRGANSKSGAAARPRARKRSFRLDMTPMVDLAFLLLTFFMLTTTFAKSRVMQLTMPVPTPADQESGVPESQAMTVLLGPGREVAYYFGLNEPADPTVRVPTLHRTDFSQQGLRRVLLQQRRPGLVVLIKADTKAHYQSLVDALDEMNITGQKKYALTELSAADRQLLAASGAR